MNRFDGKVALVTGAASGIGLATATRLAREGARVLACDINAALLKTEMDVLLEQGLDVSHRTLDVTSRVDCEGAVADVVARFGKLDVLCNIAGILILKSFTDVSDEDWARIQSINVTGPFYMCRAAIPHLLESRGNIINISSANGLVGGPFNAAYCASKGAVLMLSRALAVEYASRGVRVNAVCPGHVITPMTGAVRPPTDGDLTLMHRLLPLVMPGADPSEIAAAIAYLASDESRFVTGSAFVIDGGLTAI